MIAAQTAEYSAGESVGRMVEMCWKLEYLAARARGGGDTIRVRSARTTESLVGESFGKKMLTLDQNLFQANEVNEAAVECQCW